jgi:hypothetical protein
LPLRALIVSAEAWLSHTWGSWAVAFPWLARSFSHPARCVGVAASNRHATSSASDSAVRYVSSAAPHAPTAPTAQIRLAGWTSPSSRGLCCGDALLPSTGWKQPKPLKGLTSHAPSVSMNRGSIITVGTDIVDVIIPLPSVDTRLNGDACSSGLAVVGLGLKSAVSPVEVAGAVPVVSGLVSGTAPRLPRKAAPNHMCLLLAVWGKPLLCTTRCTPSVKCMPTTRLYCEAKGLSVTAVEMVNHLG